MYKKNCNTFVECRCPHCFVSHSYIPNMPFNTHSKTLWTVNVHLKNAQGPILFSSQYLFPRFKMFLSSGTVAIIQNQTNIVFKEIYGAEFWLVNEKIIKSVTAAISTTLLNSSRDWGVIKHKSYCC